MSKEIPKEVKTFVRATLISASSGIKQTKFPKDYEKYAGTMLNWRKMGFKDLYEFLLAIPDVARLTYSEKDGENLVFGVANKDVYASSHAQKAAMKGTLGPKHRPPSEWGKPMNKNLKQKGGKNINERKIDVPKDLSSLKVTVGNIQLKDEGLCPNLQGLYGVHISNLPKPCTKEELEQVFQVYPSLKECKLVTHPQRNTCAFVKFSSAQDALMALQQKDGYVLKGSKLKLNKAKEGKTEESQKQKDKQQKSENNPMNSPVTTGKQSQNMQPATNKDHLRSGSGLSSNSSSTTSLDRLPSSVSTNTNQTKQNETSVKQHSSQNLGIHSSRENQGQQSSSIQQSQRQRLQQHNQQQQQQQDVQVQQQKPQQQNSGHFPSVVPASTSTASSHPVSPTSVSKSIHLILSKEEMDRMNRACGHQVNYRLDKLPLEFEILVTDVIDACHFWAIIDFQTGNWGTLKDIETKIQQLSTKPNVPQKYTIGAGRFTENDTWYRCFVLDVSYDGKYIKVLYSDYGNAEWIQLERFTTLDQQLWSLPPQANLFHLAGLELSNHDINNVQEGAAFLKNLLCNITFLARKKPTVNPQQPHIVEVELFDRRQQNQSINSLMTGTKYIKPSVNPGPQSKVLSENTQNSSKVKKDKDFDVRIKLSITWVHTPEALYFTVASPETSQTLKRIEKLLDEIPLQALIFPKVGELACYVTMEHGRKRVKIVEIPKSNNVFHNVTEVKVIYIDSGMVCYVPVTSLLQMTRELTSIPKLAKRARLADVKLPDGLSSWPHDAMQVLLSRKSKPFDAKIVNQLQDGTVVIELYQKGENVNEKIMSSMKPYEKTTTASSPENKSTSSNENLTTDQGNSSNKASGCNQESRGLNSISPPKESTTGAHLQKLPIAANLAGNQSNPATQTTGNKVQNNQSEKLYYPSLPEGHYKPVTSGGSSVATQVQNRSDLGSTTNTTNTYNYYMPPPPYDQKGLSPAHAQHTGPPHDQKMLSSAHAQHTGPVYQGLPLARSAVQEKSAQDFSANERSPSDPRQNVLSSSTQNSTNSAGYRKEESGKFTKDKDSVAPKDQNISPSYREKNHITLTEKERNEQIMKGKESPVPTKQSSKIMTDQEWKKEKELLLARKQDQQVYIEKLSKHPPVKPSAQNNLQELKLRLEKQIRIKELENRALKLKKEVEALEAAKAELQYQLMNS